MADSSINTYLQTAGVPDHAIAKVKSTIYAWFVMGLVAGVGCGIWMVVTFMKYR